MTYDGTVLGAVASKKEAESARKDLEAITAQTLGKTYAIDASLLQYDSGWMLRQDLEDKETYETELVRLHRPCDKGVLPLCQRGPHRHHAL